MRRCVIISLAIISLPFGSVLADLIGHGGMIRSVDFSPDGRQVVTGSFDYSAIIWNFEDQEIFAVLEGHTGPVTNAKFLDKNRIFTTGDDKVGLVWRVEKNKANIEHRLEGHTHKIMAAAAFDNSRYLATGSWDKTVRIWSAQSGKIVLKIEVSVPVNTLAVTENGKSIAVGGHDNSIRIFDLKTGSALGKLRGHSMGITELRASSNGKYLLSSSIDKTLRLWDVQQKESIRLFERHDSQVFGVRFTPDGKNAVSGGKDGYVLIWDLTTGKLTNSIKAHKDIVWSVAISPDGRFAVTGSSDETARVWHLSTGDRIGFNSSLVKDDKPWLKSRHPGALMFQKCARCHALSPLGVRRSGPHFKGLFGRRVGSVEGYRYSKALKNKDFVWNRETLFQLFDEGPDKFLPGTKMPVQRVTDARKLARLVEYLEELTGSAQ